MRDAKEPGAVPMGDLETPKYMGPWGHGAGLCQFVSYVPIFVDSGYMWLPSQKGCPTVFVLFAGADFFKMQ